MIASTMLAAACGESAPRVAADASLSSDAGSENRRDGSTALDGSPADASPTADAGVSTQDAGPLGGDAGSGGDSGSGGAQDSGADGGGDAMPVDWPDDESQPPPPIDLTKPYDIVDATRFLYEGDNPIQTGVAPGTIRAETIAIIRGAVVDRAGQPVVGAQVTVLDHAEYGTSRTKADGVYELAVNGGVPLTLSITQASFLPVQRQVNPPWKGWARAPDVVMTQLDAVATEVRLLSLTEPIVAEGTRQEDADGPRTARIVFEPGLTAAMRLPDGTEVGLDTLTVRATEYTVGEDGPKAMPAELPPSSMYTYAVELSVDEAMAVGATMVSFSKPVPAYLDNFLRVPVGTIVPVGLYDRACGCWIPSENGRVLKLLAVDGDSKAILDVDGDGDAASVERLGQLGITDHELAVIPAQFEVGESFWRSPIPHFTPVDWNFGGGPPPGAAPPPGGGGCGKPPCKEPDICEQGSVIGCFNQTLAEAIEIPGTPYSLVYSSQSTPNSPPGEVLIPLTGDAVHPELRAVELQVTVAGQTTKMTFPPAPRQSTYFRWDGRDAWSRRVGGTSPMHIRIGYRYPVLFSEPANMAARAFMRTSGTSMDLDREASTLALEKNYTVLTTQTALPSPGRTFGLWSLDVHHELSTGTNDVGQRILRRGDGSLHETDFDQNRAAESVLTRTEVLDALAAAGVPQTNLWRPDCPMNPSAEGGVGEQVYYRDAVTPTEDGGFYYWASIGAARCQAWALLRKQPDKDVEYLGGGAESSACVYQIPLGELPDDGIDAKDACISKVATSRVAPNGDFYFGTWGPNRLYRITRSGRLYHVGGSSTGSYSAGGPVKTTFLGSNLRSMAIATDWTIYLADYCYIMRLTPDGVVEPFYGVHPGASSTSPRGTEFPECSQQPIYFPSGNYESDPRGVQQPWNIQRVEVNAQGEVYIHVEPTWNTIDVVSANGGIRRITDPLITTNSPPREGKALEDVRLTGTWAKIGLSRAGELMLATIVGDRMPLFLVRGGVLQRVADFLRAERIVEGSELVGTSGTLLISPNSDLFATVGPAFGGGWAAVTQLVARFSAQSPRVPSLDGSEAYLFDALGRHEETIDALTGSPIRAFEYDPQASRLTGVREERSHRTTRLDRGADGTLRAIVGASGEQTTLNYDPEGYLSTVTLPGGGLYRMEYSKAGALTRFEQPSGRVSTLRYDESGRLIEDLDNAGQGWTLAREELPEGNGYRVRTIRPTGEERVYEVRIEGTGEASRTTKGFDGSEVNTTFGPTTEVTAHPDGTVETKTLTADPRFGMDAPYVSRLELRNPATNQTQTMTRSRAVVFETPGDPMSALKQSRDTHVVGGQTITDVYDAETRTRTWTNANTGRRVFVEADEGGRPVAAGIGGRTSSDLRQMRFAYDAAHHLTRVEGPHPDMSDDLEMAYEDGTLRSIRNALGHTVTYEWAHGHVQKTTLATGLEVVYARDGGGRVTETSEGGRVTRYAFDPALPGRTTTTPVGRVWSFEFGGPDGSLSKLTMPSGDRAEIHHLEGQNRVETRLIDPTGVERGLFVVEHDAGSRTVTKTFGARRLTMRRNVFFPKPASIVAGGETTTFAYDALGRISSVRDPGGAQHRYAYAANGDVTMTDAAGRTSGVVLSAFGEPASYRDAASGSTTYLRDSAGFLTGVSDSESSLSIERDVIGRVLKVDFADSSDDDMFFTYDEPPHGTGRLTTARNGSGATSLSYDEYGQVTDRTEVIGQVSLPLHYAYDLDGQVTAASYPSGMTVHYDRDAAGRILGIRASIPGDASQRVVLRDAAYLPFGGVESYQLGDQEQRARTRVYDSGYRLLRDSTEGVVDWAFAYDASGHLTELREHSSGRVQTFAYDADGRIVRATDNQRDGTIAFTYNAVGDRMSMTVDSLSTTYGYDGTTGRLTRVTPPGGSMTSLSYDSRGSLRSDGTWTYTHSPAGSLVAVEAASDGEVIAQYGYNTRNERVEKRVAGVGTLFVYGKDKTLLGEYDDAGAPIRELIWFGSSPVASVEYGSGGTYELLWIHADHLEAPRLLTNRDGVVLWAWRGDPFGDILPDEDVDRDGDVLRFNLRFPGQYFDPETGLHQNHHRSYDPSLGRYIESDPIGVRAGFNLYAYARGNPVELVDPGGLFTPTRPTEGTHNIYIVQDPAGLHWEVHLCAGASCIGAEVDGQGRYSMKDQPEYPHDDWNVHAQVPLTKEQFDIAVDAVRKFVEGREAEYGFFSKNCRSGATDIVNTAIQASDARGAETSTALDRIIADTKAPINDGYNEWLALVHALMGPLVHGFHLPGAAGDNLQSGREGSPLDSLPMFP
ncbi:MAG: hypothetical protein IPK13_02520 [Deltaproteobacteria bacterium]|nr:hypothetical protein [Deltaproteobacteria bacterium]